MAPSSLHGAAGAVTRGSRHPFARTPRGDRAAGLGLLALTGALAGALVATACSTPRAATGPNPHEPPAPAAAIAQPLPGLPEAIADIDLAPVAASSQILLVIAEDTTQHATAWLLERESSGTFRVALGPLPACVGARGFAPPGEKKEGDRRSPTGAFPLPESYSSDASFASKLAHRVVTERDAICEDPASPLYNRWVALSDPNLPPWTPAERDMMELGLIVDYNRDPIVPGAGSGILVHAAGPGPTSAGTLGCVGLSKPDLRAVVARLDAARRPMILMGQRRHLRLVAKEP